MKSISGAAGRLILLGMMGLAAMAGAQSSNVTVFATGLNNGD